MVNYDILICGAGVPGIALSNILANAGLSVCLVDAGPTPLPYDANTPDGRTIALMNPSIQTLERAQLWQSSQAHACPLATMSVIDDSKFPAGTLLQESFSANELGEPSFGHNIPLLALRAGFKPNQKNLTFLPNTRLTALKPGLATLSNNQTISAKLIIGADGKNSVVRNLSHIKETRRPYGQIAITCAIKHSRPHNNTSTEFHRTGGPFTLVPMQGGHLSAIVWVEYEAEAKTLLSLPRANFEHALAERTRNLLGTIQLASNPASFPLEYMRAQKLTAPRTALMAEAAHVMSPIGAQGMNLSLRDVETLSTLIIEHHQNGLDIGSPTLLAAYEKSRKKDMLTRTTAIDYANRLVASKSPLLRLLRRTTLHALSLPSPLRKLAMKSGLSA